jgi:hypothetical protein
MKKIKKIFRALTPWLMTKKRKYELAKELTEGIILSYKSNGITLNLQKREKIYSSVLNALKLKKK